MAKTNIIGIIGGSGLDNPEIFKEQKTTIISTKFGAPSSALKFGKISSHDVVLLSRHGIHHNLTPSSVPYQANIWALKSVGCTHIIATTACGSLRQNMKPGDLVFPDQFIDFTKHRKQTFYEDTVVHTPMAYPFDCALRTHLSNTAKKMKIPHHSKGVILTIEGPRFSSQAESRMFRIFGADLVNMSTVPEVVLANELSIPYQAVSMVTDYDSWKTRSEPLSFDLIMERMRQNSQNVIRLLQNTIAKI